MIFSILLEPFCDSKPTDSYSPHGEESNGTLLELFEQKMFRLRSVVVQCVDLTTLQTADSCYEELKEQDETFCEALVPKGWNDEKLSEIDFMTSALLLTLPKELWPGKQFRPDPRSLRDIIDSEREWAMRYDSSSENYPLMEQLREVFTLRGMTFEAILCELHCRSEHLWSTPHEETLQGTIQRRVQSYLTALAQEVGGKEPIMKCLAHKCKFRTDDCESWETHICQHHQEISKFIEKEGLFYGSLRMKQWHSIAYHHSFARGIRKIAEQKWYYQKISTLEHQRCAMKHQHSKKSSKTTTTKFTSWPNTGESRDGNGNWKFPPKPPTELPTLTDTYTPYQLFKNNPHPELPADWTRPRGAPYQAPFPQIQKKLGDVAKTTTQEASTERTHSPQQMTIEQIEITAETEEKEQLIEIQEHMRTEMNQLRESLEAMKESREEERFAQMASAMNETVSALKESLATAAHYERHQEQIEQLHRELQDLHRTLEDTNTELIRLSHEQRERESQSLKAARDAHLTELEEQGKRTIPLLEKMSGILEESQQKSEQLQILQSQLQQLQEERKKESTCNPIRELTALHQLIGDDMYKNDITCNNILKEIRDIMSGMTEKLTDFT